MTFIPTKYTTNVTSGLPYAFPVCEPCILETHLTLTGCRVNRSITITFTQALGTDPDGGQSMHEFITLSGDIPSLSSNIKVAPSAGNGEVWNILNFTINPIEFIMTSVLNYTEIWIKWTEDRDYIAQCTIDYSDPVDHYFPAGPCNLQTIMGWTGCLTENVFAGEIIEVLYPNPYQGNFLEIRIRYTPIFGGKQIGEFSGCGGAVEVQFSNSSVPTVIGGSSLNLAEPGVVLFTCFYEMIAGETVTVLNAISFYSTQDFSKRYIAYVNVSPASHAGPY